MIYYVEKDFIVYYKVSYVFFVWAKLLIGEKIRDNIYYGRIEKLVVIFRDWDFNCLKII